MGRTHSRPWARSLAAIALTLACAAAVALGVPTAAQAAVFVSEYPVTTVHLEPTVVSVDVFSSVALDERSPQITIDGIAYKTFLANVGSVSGGWTSSEVWDAARGVWVIRWTWTPSAPDATKATLYTYPVFATPLSDGPHNVVASARDIAGATFTDRWTFIIGIAPKLGTPTPAPDSTTSTTSPLISLPVSDNGPGPLTATATVNGAPVLTSVSGGSVRLASTVLPNDATATVAATVTDAAGNKGTKTWSFFVEVYPQMSSTIGQCTSCHPDAAKSPDMDADCSMCHAGQQDRPHTGTTASLHARADVVACSPCHVSDITVEHARRLSRAGTPITCLTCHTSSDPKVVSAIGTGDTRCVACHTGTSGHESLHTTTVTPTCAGTGCHAGTSLTAIHINAGTTLSCDTCHKSADPKVVSAIGGHDKSCTACHSASSPHGDATLHTATLGTLDSIEYHGGTLGTSEQCVTCHASDDLVTLHASDCALCHGTSGPRASFTTWQKGCQQGDCHPAIHQDEASGHVDYQDCFWCHNEDMSLPCTSCHNNGPDTTPPATTMSPSGPLLVGPTPIVLSASDDSGPRGVKATYHRLDNGPIVAGTLVQLDPPSTGSANHVLEYWSTDYSQNVETTHVVPLNISADTSPPVTGSDAKSSYNGPAVVHFTVADNATVQGGCTTYWTVDGGAQSTGAIATVPQPASGSASHTLRFWSVDAAGNTETPTNVPMTLNADTAVPSTTCDVPHYWNPANVQILNFHITDPAPSSGIADVGMGISNGTLNNKWGVGGSGNLWWRASFNVQAQGPQTLSYWAIDNAGNEESHNTTTVVVDWTAPTTTTDAVSDYVGSATITFAATDALSPIIGTKYAMSYPGFPNAAVSGTSVTVTPPASGSTPGYVYYYSGDAAGNWESSTKQNAQFRIWAVGTPTMTYAAGANGSLSGKLFQPILSGGSGTAVTAVATSGYHFVNWSDGVTANPRTDTNVTASKKVTANFALGAN